MGPGTRTRVFALAAILLIAASATSSAQPPTQLQYPTKKPPRSVRKGRSELPDPSPLSAKRLHRMVIKWDKNAPALRDVNVVDLSKSQVSERWAGRFALELFERGVLIERVRFNFPMLGAELREGGKSVATSIDANVATTAEVSFPAVDRGDKLELRDRATGRRWSLAWPPRPEEPAAIRPDAKAKEEVSPAPGARSPMVK